MSTNSSSYSPTLKILIRDCMALNQSQRPDTAMLYARFTALGSGWKAKAAQQALTGAPSNLRLNGLARGVFIYNAIDDYYARRQMHMERAVWKFFLGPVVMMWL